MAGISLELNPDGGSIPRPATKVAKMKQPFSLIHYLPFVLLTKINWLPFKTLRINKDCVIFTDKFSSRSPLYIDY